MTYTTPQDFSDTTVEPMPSTFQKLKTLRAESTQRYQRVASILKSAFAETMVELKEGKSVISPLAKEVTAETVATVKEKGQQAKDTVNTAWKQEATAEDPTDRLIRVMRLMAKATQEKLFPQLKTQAVKLDGFLGNRYGSQYDSFKGRFDFLRDRYAASTQSKTEAAPTADAPVVIEVDSEVID